MKHFLFVVLIICNTFRLSAQTITWTGAATDPAKYNAWDHASNWSPSAVPTPCNQVVIPTVTSGRYPQLNANVFIDGLTFSGGSLNLNNYDLSFISGGAGLQPIEYGGSFTSDQIIFGETWRPQRPSTSYAIQKSVSTCAPIYRFEIHPGDNWSGDLPSPSDPDGNSLNGQVKERAELYHKDVSFPFETDIWIAYSMFVEPGSDIVYRNPAYSCNLGQWHQASSSSMGGSPYFSLTISNQGDMAVVARKLVSPQPNQPIPQDTWTITRNAWHDVVIKANFSRTQGQSTLTIWVDDDKEKVNLTGLTMGDTAASNAGYWKFGIYRTAADTGPDPEDPFLPNGDVDDRTNLSVRYANVEVSTSSLLSRVSVALALD